MHNPYFSHKQKWVYAALMLMLSHFVIAQLCPAPADFNLITPCYVNGARASSPNDDVIVLFNHATARGTAATKQVVASYSEVGTVWGLAYNPYTKKLYAAAFLKRHCDLSPDGLGAIYEIDLTTATTAGAGTPTLWMNLNSTTHLGAGATLFPTETAANRGLGAINLPSHDVWAYTRVGKQGLGDIEITADGTKMYVMDLTNRQVLEINIATKTVTNRYPVNAPANYTNAADRRPFGIKHYNGELYIGVVSSGETAGKKKDVRANVMKLSGSSFTNVYEVDSMAVEPPDHIGEENWVTSYRGNPNFGTGLGWNKYSDAVMTGNDPNNPYDYIQNPVPLVSDIEFDNAGNMVIGIMDWSGHRMGAFNYRADPAFTTLHNIQSHGDIVRAMKSGSTWVKENGVGDFYNDMKSVPDQPGWQDDTFKGGMIISDCNGTELIVGNMQDPFTLNEGGSVWMKTGDGLMQTNNTGSRVTGSAGGMTIAEGSRIRIYLSQDAQPSTFGKAAGLGDIVGTYSPACVKPVAGPDQSPACVGTTPITTATLAATAVSGGTWTQLGTTPNTATITTASSATSTVTGLVPGVYQFIWAISATCSDTVKITIPNCVPTCPLTAPTLTLADIDFAPGVAPVSENVTLNGGTNVLPESNVAGFYFSSSSEGPIYAICTQISQPILPLQNPYTHEANNTANGFTTALALRIAQVVQASGYNSTTGFGTGNNTVTNFVALQLAVWNALYDSDYSVTAGSFQALTDNNAGARALANTWLTAAQAIISPTVVVHNLHNATGQDLLMVGDIPPISLIVTQPTCAGANSPNNGSITIVGFTTGQRYQYSAGTTFNSGSAIPATITAIPSGGVITTSLPNTTGSYTVRIYDVTDAACFTDRTVTITSVVCCVKPVAKATPKTQTICVGGAVTAYTTTPTTGVEYKWYGPLADTTGSLGTAIATQTTASYTPTSTALTTAGTKYYAVVVNTTGDLTCADTAFVQLVVNAKPVIADGTAIICVGESVDLTSKITNYANLLNRVWTVATAGGTAVTTPTAVKPAATTTYVLVAENAAGCKDTANVAVTVNAKPNAGTDKSLACADPAGGTLQTTTTLTGFAPAGGTWAAQTGNPATAAVTNAGAVTGMTVAGTYKFIYILNTCSDTVAVTIEPCSGCVKPNAGNDQSICAPATTATLTGFAPAGGTWAAQTGNPATAAVTNAGAVSGMTANGTYKFIYSVVAGGQTCTDTVQIIRNEKPTVGDAAICAPATTASVTRTPAGGTWVADAANPATATIISTGAVSGLTANGTYKFIYTLNGCSDTATVVRNAKPNAGTDKSLVCADPAAGTLQTTTTLTGFSPAGGTWAAQSGNPATAAVTNAGAVTGMTVAGTYKFIYTVSDCSDTVAVTVEPCTTPCVKPKWTVTTAPTCAANLQTYSVSFSVTGKNGIIKASAGTLTNPSVNNYTVTGIPNATNLKITDSLSAVCKFDTTITGPNCNCTPKEPTLLNNSFTVCAGDTFPTLKATVVGLATVEWFTQATGGTAVATGLSYKPAGTVPALGDTLYAQARSTDPTCPAAISTARVPAFINAQNCTVEVDLALKKLINKKIAQIGDELTYTIKVFNQLNVAATGVEVTDSIATSVQFVAGSFVASRGNATTTGNVIKWTIGGIAANAGANGDTVTLVYRVKATQEGVHFNTAEICKTNEKDVDSTPCNHDDKEDDIDRQCFTVPIKLCPGEKVQARVSNTYTNVQWYKNGGSTPIASGNEVMLSDIGVYTYTASNQTCPAEGCCPIIIEAGVNCCPVEVCVPFTVKKKKK